MVEAIKRVESIDLVAEPATTQGFFEGKNVPRSFDLMLHNDKNTPPAPLLQGPVIGMGKDKGKSPCLVCDKEL